MPTTRRVASDRGGPSSIRCTPYGERVSARPVRIGVGGEAVWGLDPACVHVDCSGPVREDVPGDGLLGEGLTGENDRLKSGLQRRTPTIPLRGLRSRGGGDRYVNSGYTNRVSVGRVRSALLRRGLRRVAT